MGRPLLLLYGLIEVIAANLSLQHTYCNYEPSKSMGTRFTDIHVHKRQAEVQDTIAFTANTTMHISKNNNKKGSKINVVNEFGLCLNQICSIRL
jgi:hypothetical protein